MGFCKSCCQTCLAMCCLIPMSWIAFTVFDLGSAITGGALENIGDALTIALQLATNDTQTGGLLSVIVGGLIGVILVTMFPMHWLLQYRPDQPQYAIALMVPWVLTVFISALLFSKSMKEGFMLGIKIAIGYMVLGIFILQVLMGALAQSGMEGVFTGLFRGLTDLDPVPAVIMATLEGGLIGGVFGALAGAIRYDPNRSEEEEYSPKKAKKKDREAFSSTTVAAPSYPSYTIASSRPSTCPNCGKPLDPGTVFCTNCGHRVQ